MFALLILLLYKYVLLQSAAAQDLLSRLPENAASHLRPRAWMRASWCVGAAAESCHRKMGEIMALCRELSEACSLWQVVDLIDINKSGLPHRCFGLSAKYPVGAELIETRLLKSPRLVAYAERVNILMSLNTLQRACSGKGVASACSAICQVL